MLNLLPSDPGVISFLQSGASAQPVEKDTEAGAGAGKACPKTFTLEAQGFTAAESVFMMEIKVMYRYVQTFFCLSGTYRGIGTLLLHASGNSRELRHQVKLAKRYTGYADDTKCEEE
jgi:hypothetical protein